MCRNRPTRQQLPAQQKQPTCSDARALGPHLIFQQRHEEVGPQRGDRAALLDNHGSTIGSVLRTREKANPLYISPGHLIDVQHAVEFVLKSCTSYRLPEPTRWAHKVAGGEKLPGADDEQQPRLFQENDGEAIRSWK